MSPGFYGIMETAPWTFLNPTGRSVKAQLIELSLSAIVVRKGIMIFQDLYPPNFIKEPLRRLFILLIIFISMIFCYFNRLNAIDVIDFF